MDYQKTHHFTKDKRTIIQPNQGFQQDLMKYSSSKYIQKMIVKIIIVQLFVIQMSRSSEPSFILNIHSKQVNLPSDKGNLYLSGVACLSQAAFLKDKSISCVLSILDKWGYQKFKVKEKVQHNLIKHHKWIDIEDNQDVNIFPFLQQMHTYIKAMLENHNVVVHCQMGISRSSSVVIAFLMKEYRMSYSQARIFTKDRRKIVEPNQGFEKDLIKFQEYLKANPIPKI